MFLQFYTAPRLFVSAALRRAPTCLPHVSVQTAPLHTPHRLLLVIQGCLWTRLRRSFTTFFHLIAVKYPKMEVEVSEELNSDFYGISGFIKCQLCNNYSWHFLLHYEHLIRVRIIVKNIPNSWSLPLSTLPTSHQPDAAVCLNLPCFDLALCFCNPILSSNILLFVFLHTYL